MVIIQLNGGLGNQLFQYALGRKLALEYKTSLKFDVSAFVHPQNYRSYKLKYFNIAGVPISRVRTFLYSSMEKFGNFRETYLKQVDKRPYYLRKIIKEQSTGFDPNIFMATRNVYLKGYWQSEKYFSSIRSILLNDLTLVKTLDNENRKLEALIQQTNSVSVHVRHGDYLHKPELLKIHGVLPVDYYSKAIEQIKQRVANPHFFVFSDDIPWAKENLNFNARITYVTSNASENDYIDLHLMRACKYHVTANSSFSWWGAWLSGSEEKIVIAPHKWYLSGQSTVDLIPENWLQV